VRNSGPTVGVILNNFEVREKNTLKVRAGGKNTRNLCDLLTPDPFFGPCVGKGGRVFLEGR